MEIIKNPLIYILASFTILILFHKASNYINISGIWKEYFRFLKTDKHTFKIICIVFIVPVLLAISTTMIKKIDSDILNNIMVVVSIIMSMLFTVLALIKDNKTEPKNNTQFEVATIEEVKEETISIIHYLVLLNILIILLSFIFPVIPETNKKTYFIGSVIFYSLLYHDFFNILIVVKRYSKLI